MSTPVPLTDERHADLRVEAGHGAALGDARNLVPVFVSELNEVQREYAVLFQRLEDGGRQLVALLGFEKDENLFLDESRWDARYVPAFLARGPFMIGFDGDGPDTRSVVYVDEASPRIAAAGGEAIFTEHGGNTPYFDHVLRVLRLIEKGQRDGGPILEQLAQHDLLEPLDLTVRISAEQEAVIPGFETINTERLAALSGDALAELNASGALRTAFLAAASLSNVQHLALRKQRRSRAA